MLSIDRTIEIEVLDGGRVTARSGGLRIAGTLQAIPGRFIGGAAVGVALHVGGENVQVQGRVHAGNIACEPGATVRLDVERVGGSRVDRGYAFDLVPLTPAEGNTASQVTPGPWQTLPPSPADFDDDEPTGVVGSLKEMPVSEIAQTLKQGQKDALVEIKPKGGERGVFYTSKGQVVHARVGNLEGESAFFELLGAARGAFRIRYGRKTELRTIQRDTMFLLLEGARVSDEKQAFESGEIALPSLGDDFGDAALLDAGLDGFVEASVAPPASPHSDDAPPTLMVVPGLPIDEELAAAMRGSAERPLVSGPVLERVRTETVPTADHELDAVPRQVSGLFARFFDEAGVPSDSGEAVETHGFTSLSLVIDDDDDDRVDTDRTQLERRQRELRVASDAE
jgi:hypothetical protein